MINNQPEKFIRLICPKCRKIINPVKIAEIPIKCPDCGSQELELYQKTEVITK